MKTRKKEVLTLKNPRTHADVRLEFAEMMNSPMTYAEVLYALGQAKQHVQMKMIKERKGYDSTYEMEDF